MERGLKLSAWTNFLSLGLGMLFLAGCSSRPATIPSVRVAGACDVLTLTGGACDALPMLGWVGKGIQQGSGLTPIQVPSTDSLGDLKAGRADVALLGREPAPGELKGLQDQVIAYDAVCILISSRTYTGGLQQGFYNGSVIQPTSKYDGLQQLKLDDLRGFYANLLQKSNPSWQLQGLTAGYYTFQDYTDDFGVPIVDPDQPDHMLGMWVWNAIPLQGEMLPPGKFDTQAALLQKLGFQESDLTKQGISFAPKYFQSEEELISWRYSLDPLEGQAISSLGFDFYLLMASRQVTMLAIQHGFQLRVLSIDGIDPTGDPQAIYQNAYPLSRKIHLVTPASASPAAQTLARYLLSPAGQQLVARAGYLPLP